MRLEGIHHVTAITADAPANVRFYSGVLGLRLVKKTVNFDSPDVYHLYYGDDLGSPGSAMTFFEFPGAAPGRAGQGTVHQVTWRVGSEDAIAFWAERLDTHGVASEGGDGRLGFRDPEGLALELVVDGAADPPLAATAPDVAPELALLGFAGVRAYGGAPGRSERLLGEGLGAELLGEGAWRLAGHERSGVYAYDPPPAERGVQGAGTVHHVAFASRDADHEGWRDRVAAVGTTPTPVLDRTYFRSVYFREPSGVLFEIATLGPGFTVDEPADRLGEALMLPERHEPRRAELERSLTPLPAPRTAADTG